MLCELEHSLKPLFHQSPGDSSQEDSLNWVARLEMTQNSYRAKEPILALRRALLSLNKRFAVYFVFVFLNSRHLILGIIFVNLFSNLLIESVIFCFQLTRLYCIVAVNLEFKNLFHMP